MASLDKLLDSPGSRRATAFFALIGLAAVSLKVFSVVRLFASLFVLPGESLTKYGRKGTWALVTGASEGLGREYALQLAAKGFNIILASRSQSKLDTVASELATRHPNISVRTFVIDFSSPSEATYSALSALASELEIGILINNVGRSHSIPVPFLSTDTAEIQQIVNINCLATLRVTQIIVPAMVTRRRGLVLTMASFGGVLPTPLLATYSGSKAFLQNWSTALAAELQGTGVRVQLVQANLVVSAMSKIRRPTMSIPSAKDFVRAALGKIGRSGGAQGVYATSSPYWAHGLVHWALLQVGTMRGVVAGFNRRMHEDIRNRALRKAAREAKKGQ